MDPRFVEINNLLISYSLGDFNRKIFPSNRLDEIDAFITNINMLGEELKISTISKNYFNNIFHSVSDMLFVLDATGTINSINKAVTDRLNYSETEMRGKSIDCLAGDTESIFAKLKKEMRTTPVVHLDRDIYSSKGEAIPVNCTCNFLYNQNRESIGYLLTIRDQTTIRKFERSLVESEKKYKSIFEGSSDCLFVLDKNSKFIDINEAGLKLFKYPLEVMKTKRIQELVYDQGQRVIIRHELNSKGFVVDYELNFIDANNDILICLVSGSVVYNNAGEKLGWQGIIKDISAQKKTESLVIRAIVDTQEKERIRIARDIHDSLSQKLSSIMFYLGAMNSLQGKTKYTEVFGKSKEALNDAMNELSTISFNLMPGTLQHFGLRQALNELCHKNEWGDTLKIKLQIKEKFAIEDSAISITLFRITQEFIHNAVKHGKAKRINIKMDIDKKKKIIVAVLKDNGKGFAIKQMKKYTGMGLKNVNSRVESHNGSVKISSIVNKGTTYEIAIPVK